MKENVELLTMLWGISDLELILWMISLYMPKMLYLKFSATDYGPVIHMMTVGLLYSRDIDDW